jgi:hypothetical protein
MNSLLKSIVLMLGLYSVALLPCIVFIALFMSIIGCAAPKVQSPKSHVQSWWETQNVTNPDSIILKAIRDETNFQIILPIYTNLPILTPSIIQVSKSLKSKVSTVAKPPVPMIRLSWTTEWRDVNGIVQLTAISVIRSSTSLQTVKQGTIRMVARTNQIVVPRTEQQEFFVVANDYSKNYTN